MNEQELTLVLAIIISIALIAGGALIGAIVENYNNNRENKTKKPFQ
jgi:hypothetical protein